MLPIYIICHAECVPSAYLCQFLEQRNILYHKLNALNSDLSELDLDNVAALIVMGGAYSVNDALPWQGVEIHCIERAIQKNIPIMGVCLGAQLISKALGAEVLAAENPEVGWYQVSVERSYLGDLPALALHDSFEVFEWHEDRYAMPEGAIPLFRSATGENQAYLFGRVLVMQFHLEMTEYLVHEWLDRYRQCLPNIRPRIQSPDHILENLEERLHNLHTSADIIYEWWLRLNAILPANQ